MIKKVLFTTIFFALSLLADFNPSLYIATLSEVSNDTAKVDDKNISIGASGIVLHSFDDKHKTIIANARVVSKENGKLTVVFSKFDRLVQKALPDYKIKPSKGDILILNYLYNRVLPIVPDQESLKEFKENFPAFEIVHPDLFGSKLFFENEPIPAKSDFRSNCIKNDYSLLFFKIEKRGYFVDCNTFDILGSVSSLKDANTTQKPFYTRVLNIKNSLGGILGEKDIGDYVRYYKKLLGIK